MWLDTGWHMPRFISPATKAAFQQGNTLDPALKSFHYNMCRIQPFTFNSGQRGNILTLDSITSTKVHGERSIDEPIVGFAVFWKAHKGKWASDYAATFVLG